jgi:hypothetical protein
MQRHNLAVEEVVIERQTHLLAFQEILAWVLSAEFQWPNNWQELVMGDERMHYLFLD